MADQRFLGQTTGLALGLCLALAPALGAQVGGVWQDQGPGPAANGQVENVVPDDDVVGAVHTVVADPDNADVLYAGTVNGGVWKTENATSGFPTWTKLTDFELSLSIGALALDPTDASNLTLTAGIGGFSSFGARGDRIGVLRTTDGGTNWSLLAGVATRNISGIAPRGSIIVVSANTSDAGGSTNAGVFRSTDTGTTFTQISNGDGTATGLPAGFVFDLASDPSDDTRLFAPVVGADTNGGVNGIYRSDDTGATWTKVSDPAIDALLVTNVTRNVEIAVGDSNNVFVAIANGRLTGVFRSGNGGTSWTAMSLPVTIEDGVPVGIHPGGQASIHMSIVADPTDSNIVYLGGDRQPFFGEFSGGPGFFPNSIGANDFSGRLFRGDASLPALGQWTPLTHTGTASSSSPHADSREMVFDAAGDLIETDDGGIYRRTDPRAATGDWFSLNGDLQSTEYHGVSYDTVSNVVFGGAQDTGTTEQLVPDMPDFFSTSTGDGGDTAVDETSMAGFSTRYTSFQFLQSPRRRVYDASNTFQSQAGMPLTVLGGGNPIGAQFYTPIAANEINGVRLIVAGGNSTYESLDAGNTVTEISPGLVINAFVGDPIIYGVPGNENFLLVGAGAGVFLRTAAHPAPLTAVTSPGGGTVRDLAVDPDATTRFFAVTSGAVFESSNSGTTWTDVTGDLTGLDFGTLRTMAFVPGTDDAVVVGGLRGVYVAFESTGFTDWEPLGTELPNASVFELDYDIADDALIAGLAGRGAWKLQPAIGPSDVIFTDGFESGDTTAWSSTVP
ncbi:MAG: RTX toxin [Acidobacteriota bacterium]